MSCMRQIHQNAMPVPFQAIRGVWAWQMCVYKTLAPEVNESLQMTSFGGGGMGRVTPLAAAFLNDTCAIVLASLTLGAEVLNTFAYTASTCTPTRSTNANS